MKMPLVATLFALAAMGALDLPGVGLAHAASPKEFPRAIQSILSPRYYSPKDLDTPPGIKTRVMPEYPSEAVRRSLSGTVVLRLFIDESGAVERIVVLRSHPPGVFDASALRAFRPARFSPGAKAGSPVRSQVTIEVKFENPK